MRFLVRIAPSSEDKAAFLSVIRSVSSNLYLQARNPKWTSYGALEIDLFAQSRSDFELCLLALEPLGQVEFSKDLSEAPQYRSTEEAVREARVLFNAERYWECHEVLEGAWRNLTGDEKLFVQGVILVCAALVHHQKGQEQVALSVMRRALKQLSYSRDVYFGIQVGSLRTGVLRILDSSVFEILRI